MKLLFVIKRLEATAGGAERIFCSLCSELASRGHDVTILTFDHQGSKAFFKLHPSITKLDLAIGKSAKPAGFFETFKRIWRLRREIYLLRPDVIVGFMHSMYVPVAFSAIGSRIAVVGSEHIVPEHYRTRLMQYLLLQLSACFMFKITVVSEKIRTQYPKIVRDKMTVIPNMVEISVKTPKSGIAENKPTILSVGRLDPQKDHATLIHAFAMISKQFPNWQLRIIGDGYLRPKLEELIIDLELQNKVNIIGSTKKIEDEYHAADMFVIPSRYEAFGLVTAEAMSCGLPVIGFADCPGTNELIVSGHTGILVSASGDRASALSTEMSDLIANPSQRTKLGEAACSSMQASHSRSEICNLWEDLLKSASPNKK